MVSGAEIETIPLDSLWRGSVGTVYEVPSAGIYTQGYLWLYLCVFLGLAVLFIRVFSPFVNRLVYFFNHPSTDSSLLRSGMLPLSLCAAVSASAVAGAVYLSGLFPGIPLRMMISLCAAVPVVKFIILYLIRTVSGGKEPTVAIMCLTLSCLVFLAMLLVASSVVIYFCPAFSAPEVQRTMFFILCGLLILYYLIRVTGIFLTAGIHVFCTFLYLCTVEYLPVGLLTVMLIRY